MATTSKMHLMASRTLLIFAGRLFGMSLRTKKSAWMKSGPVVPRLTSEVIMKIPLHLAIFFKPCLAQVGREQGKHLVGL